MKPEITIKDSKVYEFILDFKVCNLKHVKCFVGANQRNLLRLAANNKIEIKQDIITVKNLIMNAIDKANTLKTLDVLVDLKEKGIIEGEIKRIDSPFYAIAKSAKADLYMFFTIINKGKEQIQCKILDDENRGNVVLILEDKYQVNSINLKNKVLKIIIHNERM